VGKILWHGGIPLHQLSGPDDLLSQLVELWALNIDFADTSRLFVRFKLLREA